jgi:ABC-type transport system involved in cytochrome c biogenesis permease component
MKWPRLPGFPLLVRELLETANRPRTYLLRTLCAFLTLCFFGVVYLLIQTQQNLGGGTLLGLGGMLLTELQVSMYVVVLVLLPIQSAASFTQEKERGTLVLLLLTPMGPWQLVLQKWLSRVVAMLTLLLVILPLVAIAYSYGGLTLQGLGESLLLVVICIAQVAAMSIAISAWCRRTSRAVILALLAEPVLYLLLPLLTGGSNPFAHNFFYISLISPFEIARGGQLALPFHVSILYPLGFTALMLWLAKSILIRRSAAQGETALLKAFRAADAVLDDWSKPGKAAVRRMRDLPLTRPVLWYESHRRSLSSPRYLVRIMLLMFASAAILLPIFGNSSVIYDIVLAITLLTVLVQGATCLAEDRAQQSLGVLLTTPLEPWEIVNQKASAMGRLRWAMSALLVTIALLGYCFDRHQELYPPRNGVPAVYSLLVPLGIAIILPSICLWYAMCIGIGSRNQLLSLIRVLAHGVGWLMVFPLLLFGLLMLGFGMSVSAALPAEMLASPLLLLVFYQLGGRSVTGEDLPSPLLCFLMPVLYIGIWAWLRHRCLARAERSLRRDLA